jgi:hypothetical protein
MGYLLRRVPQYVYETSFEFPEEQLSGNTPL